MHVPNRAKFSRPVYTGDFAACKLMAIAIAAESPVVYTGDLKSPQIALEIAAEITAMIASVNGPSE